MGLACDLLTSVVTSKISIMWLTCLHPNLCPTAVHGMIDIASDAHCKPTLTVIIQNHIRTEILKVGCFTFSFSFWKVSAKE